jgi:hypothetical protein
MTDAFDSINFAFCKKVQKYLLEIEIDTVGFNYVTLKN